MASRRSRSDGWRRKVLVGGGLAGLVAMGVLLWASGSSSDSPSTCFGTSSQGGLRHSWKLPRSGANFRAYGAIPWLAGRTFVHSVVHAVVLEAYQRVASDHPEYRFVYGETGFAEGGSFEPHRTHQNGLSVDFMVPVRDASGAIVELPTSALQKFGYGLEFDAGGSVGELRIDFEAIALHLAALKRSAASRRVRVARVIFDPKLRAHLTRTRAWSSIKDLPFMLKPAWVRHDEHYHVDFDVPCRPLSEQAK